MASTALTAAAAGHPGPRTASSNESDEQGAADLERLATGSLLAHVASYLSVREGDVQSVLVAAPPAERIPFRNALVQDPAYLSQAVLPGGGEVSTDALNYSTLASASTRRMIKAVLATPAGAKLLRKSAGSAGRPYTIDSDGRLCFDPSRFFANASIAIALDNQDLLEWAVEVGSLDPNGLHDYGLIVGEEVGVIVGEEVSLLFQCVECGSKECFEWLLTRNDVDINAQAYVPPDLDRWYSALSASIYMYYIIPSSPGVSTETSHFFLRRLVEHPATDVNRPSSSDGLTPLQHWAIAFSSNDSSDFDVKLEGPLRILGWLLEAGAKVHQSNTVGSTPFRIVQRETISGSPESRARHLLALNLMRGGGVVWCFLLLGNGTSAVGRMHGMVTSALNLGLPFTCIEFLLELARVISFPLFVIKRGLNDFMDLLPLAVVLSFYYTIYMCLLFVCDIFHRIIP